VVRCGRRNGDGRGSFMDESALRREGRGWCCGGIGIEEVGCGRSAAASVRSGRT